jgi:benzoyl-CoA reductase/2-hydroxyglutaryl-CoA dehydratase subunit BcrC/BadD/HgdB
MTDNTINTILDQLGKSFEELDKLQKIAIEKIPNEHAELKTKVIRDMNAMKEAMKEGNLNKITEIHQKYASTNSK